MNIRLVLIIVFLTIGLNSYSQKEKDSLLAIWNNTKLEDSTRANSYNKLIHENYLNSKPDSAYIMALDLLNFNKKNNLQSQKADAILTIANIEKLLGNFSKSLEYYKNSLKVYEAINDKSGMAVVYTNIGSLYRKDFKFDKALFYQEKSLKLSEEAKDTVIICDALVNMANIYATKFKHEKATEYYLKSLTLSKTINYIPIQSYIYTNLGNTKTKQKKFKEAISYFENALIVSRQTNNLSTEMSTLYYLSTNHLNQKQYTQCINYAKLSLHLADELGNKIFVIGSHRNLYDAYKAKNNLRLALKHLEESTTVDNTLSGYSITDQLQELEIERVRMRDSLIQIEKEVKTALVHQKEIQQKNTEKTNLTLAWGGSLSAVSIFAFLIFRNTKRKQRKAEKERQEQIVEKEKILKDLELSTIDAMIQGQEKERQRLAADLHDSVGATLSAAKLQFNYLIKNQNNAKYSEELIKKTSMLLEDAYVEIRSMAHLKNSGVMAKNGLLPAVEKLSKNASGINGLTFEVQSFGLEKRLENSLEITIFRIIQELVTNVIKHANATKSIVHITNHDDNINIMIEDNGKGFKPNQITKTNAGMGISSIDKRVEHLDGKLTIESEINKGTTVIIDIPL